MKIASGIIGIMGLLHIAALSDLFMNTSIEAKVVRTFVALFGALLVFIAYGIWTRRILAWSLGFWAIAVSGIKFVADCITSTHTHSREETLILVSALVVGTCLVGGYWARLWYKQKYWFLITKDTK
jgi:hypothetical protein